MLMTLAFRMVFRTSNLRSSDMPRLSRQLLPRRWLWSRTSERWAFLDPQTRRWEQTLIALIFVVLSTMFTMPPEPRSCSTSTLRVTERTSPRLLASLVTTTLLPESKAHLLSAPRFTRLALPLVTSLWGKFANNRIIP